jgi:hypothetical protein
MWRSAWGDSALRPCAGCDAANRTIF